MITLDVWAFNKKVKILGLEKQEMPDELPNLKAEDVSFAPGEPATFFIMRMAKENQYRITDSMSDDASTLKHTKILNYQVQQVTAFPATGMQHLLKELTLILSWNGAKRLWKVLPLL